VKKDQPKKPATKPGEPPKPKIHYRSLEEIETERRDRRLEILHKKFEATLDHMSKVEKVNEEYYQIRKELTKSAKTSVNKKDLPTSQRTPGRK
jgi:hypothetical protein